HSGDHQHQLSVARHGRKRSARYHRAAMATREANVLSVQPREPAGSRAARRLRRTGKVPGVVYGGGAEPVSFLVDSRDLRLALAHAGAVLDLNIEGGDGSPVVLK